MISVTRARRSIAALLLSTTLIWVAPALGQDAQQPAPEPDAVGPPQLRDFQLPGTRTAPAPEESQPPAPVVAPPAPTTGDAERPSATPPADPPAVTATEAEPPVTASRSASSEPAEVSAAESNARNDDGDGGERAPTAPVGRQAAETVPVPTPGISPDERQAAAPSGGLSWVYMLAALGLAALGLAAFLLLRPRLRPAEDRSEEQPEYVVAESPAPLARAPVPAAPQPARAPEPAQPEMLLTRSTAAPVATSPAPAAARPEPALPSGLVTTNSLVGIQIRPWLKLEFRPDRAAATTTEAAVQYEIRIRNDGNAIARNVSIEARMFNAGSGQDEEISSFFASPVDPGKAKRVLSIRPREGVRIKGVVAMPKENVREINVQGRRLFIPMVAFNVVYEWADGKTGQTGMSYLVGREPESPSAKMGAFRLDLGPRIYRSVGQRPSEVAVLV